MTEVIHPETGPAAALTPESPKMGAGGRKPYVHPTVMRLDIEANTNVKPLPGVEGGDRKSVV